VEYPANDSHREIAIACLDLANDIIEIEAMLVFAKYRIDHLSSLLAESKRIR
jgi:hypothetical protein